jgi:hypothetical protein
MLHGYVFGMSQIILFFFRSAALELELSERNALLFETEASLRASESRRLEETAEAQARIAELTEINAQV